MSALETNSKFRLLPEFSKLTWKMFVESGYALLEMAEHATSLERQKSYEDKAQGAFDAVRKLRGLPPFDVAVAKRLEIKD